MIPGTSPECWSRCLTTIFKHVEDPPATPVASNSAGAIKWLKHHIRRAQLIRISLTRTLRFKISRRPLVRRALRAIPSRALWLTYTGLQVSLQVFVLEHCGMKSVVGSKAHKSSDSIGTLHFPLCGAL